MWCDEGRRKKEEGRRRWKLFYYYYFLVVVLIVVVLLLHRNVPAKESVSDGTEPRIYIQEEFFTLTNF